MIYKYIIYNLKLFEVAHQVQFFQNTIRDVYPFALRSYPIVLGIQYYCVTYIPLLLYQ